jgi:hypothetical protein
MSPMAEGLNKGLLDYITQQGAQAAGRVYAIDLDAFRTRLGDRWGRVADKARAIAQQSIERHLTAVDMVAPFGDTAFLLVFAQLDRREAQLKCLLIAREVGRRLAGSDQAADMVRVRTAVTTDSADLAFDQTPGIGAVAEELDHELGGAAIRALKALPPLMTQGASHWDQLQFIYRPLLSLRGMVVSTFLCLPTRRTKEGGYLSGYQVLPDPQDEHSVVDLDMVVLAKVVTDLRGMVELGVKALLSLPVHIETLTTLRHRMAYTALCRKHLAPHADRIIFELVELPEGVPQSRLIDLVTVLRPFSRAVIARFPLERQNFAFFHLAGLHAVGADIYHCGIKEDVLMEKLDAFVDHASREGLKTYVHGLHSISLTTAAVTSGFDYIDGYSVSSVVEVPQRPLRYDLRQLYQSLLNGR